jgi:hypothetical protein
MTLAFLTQARLETMACRPTAFLGFIKVMIFPAYLASWWLLHLRLPAPALGVAAAMAMLTILEIVMYKEAVEALPGLRALFPVR